MADAGKLKRIEPIDYGEDDPFAELTRIMGFDPRVPSRPAAAGQPAQAAVAPSARTEPAIVGQDEFGFDIDLERELLGGLATDADLPAPAVSAASFDRPAQPVAADLDRDFDDAFAMEIGDLDFDLDAVEVANDDVAVDFAAPALPPVAVPVTEELPMAADRRDDDFTHGASNESAPATANAATDEDIDFGFDLAMAEIDMDFASGRAVSAPASAEEADLDFFDEDAFEQALALEGETVATATAPAYAVAEEPAYDLCEEPARAAPVEAMSARPMRPQEEPTLEDELAALLGNPVARVELPGSYDSEPFPATFAASAGADRDVADSGDGFVGFEAELAAWEPEDVAGAYDADGAYDAPEQPTFDADVDAYAADADYRDDADGYYADADAAVAAEQADLGSGPYADRYDAAVFDVDAGEPAAEEQAVAEEPVFDPLAALRSMATDLGRGSAAPSSPGYRSLATPTASPSFAAAQSSYQYRSADQSYAAPAAQSYVAPTAPSHAAAAPVDPLDSYDLGQIYDDAQMAVADDDVPEIETIDVPENAFAVADDLDLPELAFAVDDAPARGYDDFDRDFAIAYSEPDAAHGGNAAEVEDLADYADTAFASRPMDMGQTSVSMAGAAGWSHAAVDRSLDDLDLELDAAANAAFADLGTFDDDAVDEHAAAPLPYEAQRSDGSRRGIVIAAIVGGVALIGGIGAFALSYGDRSGSDVPVVVRADDTPVKVRPENPGGTVVPNQDNKVYQTVTGGVSAPSQETLITSSEEPVDVAVEGALPLNEDDVAIDVAPKGEDRVEPTADLEATGTAEEIAVVAPRKVRTMVVKPDGSLVPREGIVEETAVAEPQPGAEASAMQPAESSAAAAKTDGGTVSRAPEATPVAVEPVKTKVAKAADAPKPAEKTRTAAIPDAGPLAPSRPADQPVEVVGEVKPDQVAAVGAAGAWSVQIASQPNEAAAKSSYQDLSRRYASVIGGKGVTIVKAEISGKGTFYRVRVPAGSRSDAIALCEKYKAAGGNCFVSK